MIVFGVLVVLFFFGVDIGGDFLLFDLVFVDRVVVDGVVLLFVGDGYWFVVGIDGF